MQFPDVSVLAYSMGKPHPSVQLTGAVCLGAAATIQGTVVELLSSKRGKKSLSDISGKSANDGLPVVIGHPSGTIDVDVKISEDDVVESVTVFRTARRVFEGTIFVFSPTPTAQVGSTSI